MKQSSRMILSIALVGSLAAGALFAKPSVKAVQAVPKSIVLLVELKDAPRLRSALRQAIRELGLSPEQVDAARKVLKTHREDVAVAFDAVEAARADLHAIIRNTPTDDAALAGGADVVAAAQRELVLATVLLRADLRLILTDEQLAKLSALEARLEGRMDKVRGIVERWIEAA